MLSSNAVAEDTTFIVNVSPILELTVPSIVNLNLMPTTGADFNTASMNISVGTNNPTGYTLTMTADSDTLTRTGSVIDSGSGNPYTPTILPMLTTGSATGYTAAQFESSTTDAYTLNRWGYKKSTDTNFMPMTTSNINLTITNAPSNASTTTLDFAAKVDATKPAGTYQNTLNFTAVINVAVEVPGECTSTETCMQTFTANMCEAQASDAPVTLTDARDGSTYTVRYLQGACWMTQNLRLTDTVSSEYSNFSTNSTFNPCVGDLTAGDSYDEARCHDSGSTETGVWYNYASASAGTITGSSNDTLATEDICPAGWHLPSYDTAKPAGSVNSLLDLPIKSYFSPVTGGYYPYGSPYDTDYGYWWSSVARNDMTRYHLNYGGSSLNTSYSNRRSGLYIRCVRL